MLDVHKLTSYWSYYDVSRQKNLQNMPQEKPTAL